MRYTRKIMRLELSAKMPTNDEYYYAELLLPAENYEIRDAMQRLRAVGREDGVWISILECGELPALEPVRLDSPTLDELNFFVKRLVSMTDEERIVFNAIIGQVIPEADEGELIRMKDLINSTYGLDGVMIASNISTLEELGRFAFENGMIEELTDFPEEAVPYLSAEQIGRVQQKNDGGVFVGRYYVVAGEYQRPEIYDGKTLPNTEEMQPFMFRLKVGEYPTGATAETEDDAEWICLPISADHAKKTALKHHEPSIEACVCYDFESSIPQITSEMFGGMLDFDKLNQLAREIEKMASAEQIKFKAALCAEKPEALAGALDIAENLSQYNFYTFPETCSQFFKVYLKIHLAVEFDGDWLNSLYAKAEGDELLKRLGASLTDYGVISARGRSLYELVPYREQEAKELAVQAVTDEKLEFAEANLDENEGMQMGGMRL